MLCRVGFEGTYEQPGRFALGCFLFIYTIALCSFIYYKYKGAINSAQNLVKSANNYKNNLIKGEINGIIYL